MEKICSVCGKQFKLFPSQFKKRSLSKYGDYCSLACRQKITNVVKTCANCGKDFAVPRSNQNRYTNCSQECSFAKTCYINCQRCGKRFPKRRVGHKHCSETCRRPVVSVSCLNCGKSFRISPVHLKTAKFCSVSCYRKYQGETEPEKNVRLLLGQLDIRFIQEYRIKGWQGSMDFYLPDLNLILEVDEPYWHEKSKTRDAKKDVFLSNKGFRVLRLIATPFYKRANADMRKELLIKLAVI